jgi:hypothetical protein
MILFLQTHWSVINVVRSCYVTHCQVLSVIEGNVHQQLSWSYCLPFLSTVFYVVFCINVCPYPFSFGHCIVCPSSHYSFGIFKHFLRNKKQSVLTNHRNLGPPQFFSGVCVGHLYNFLWCVLCLSLLWVLLSLSPMLFVSLDCPFCIAPYVNL